MYSLDRDGRYSRWKEAVKRCKHWHKTDVIERVQAVKYKGNNTSYDYKFPMYMYVYMLKVFQCFQLHSVFM